MPKSYKHVPMKGWQKMGTANGDLYVTGPTILGTEYLSYTKNYSQVIQLPTNSGEIRLSTTTACYIKFGDHTAIASGTDSVYFPPGTENLGVPTGDTYIAIRGELVDGTATIRGLGQDATYEIGDTITIAYTSTSVNDTAIPTNSGKVRLYSPTDCYILTGITTAGAADSGDTLHEAGTTMEYTLTASHDVISVIRSTTDGSLYVTGLN